MTALCVRQPQDRPVRNTVLISVEDALDPLKNVQYSAKFLRTLYTSSGRDWKKAARRYHSGNPKEGQLYTDRLENRFESYRLAGLTNSMELF